MSVFTDMVTTSDVQEDDEILLRQGLTDKRINFNLADVLAWGTREGAVYLGDHRANSVYDAVNSFRLFNNQAYFVKVGVTLPYTTTSSNPLLDGNLTNMSYADYKRTVDATRYIGSTLLSFDSTNPEDLYPWQSWSLITGDASIRLGDGTTQSKTLSGGSNDPTVPVPEHTHNMDHNHPTATTDTNTHIHDIGMPWSIDENDRGLLRYSFVGTSGSVFKTAGTSGSSPIVPFSSPHSHAHAVPIPYHTGYTGSTGNAEATIDVRGRSIKMNLWVRTA